MSMNDDDDAAAAQGFADPDMLKAFFEEQDEEIANAHGLAMQGLDRTDAIRAAMISLVNILAARAPAIREIVGDDLDAAAVDHARICAAAGREYDLEGCPFLDLAKRIRSGRL